MKILEFEKCNKIIPDEGYCLVSLDDLEKPKEERYYFYEAYIPKSMTIDDFKKQYTEIPEEIEVLINAE